jgi:hypothetical protein
MPNRLAVDQFVVLFGLLESQSLLDKDFIASLFRKNAENFDETFNFLCQIKVLSDAQGKIAISKKFLSYLKQIQDLPGSQKREMISEYLINSLLHSKSDTSQEFLEYIRNYRFSDGLFVYKPTSLDNVRFADTRNFLIDLGLVEYDANEKQYIFLRPALLDEINDVEKVITVDVFEKVQKSKKELGDKAELVVLLYEKNRLAHLPKVASEIKHVSLEIVNAGFDIESFTEINNKDVAKRFIEVKAVLKNSFRFYWSRNELEKSKELGELYWLYLVQYTNKYVFDSENIDKICNPYRNVFLEQSEWLRQVELYSFQMKAFVTPAICSRPNKNFRIRQEQK